MERGFPQVLGEAHGSAKCGGSPAGMGAQSRGALFIVSGGPRAPRGPGGSREETLGGALQWGRGGREQHRGSNLRGDAPEPQEGLGDIRLVQPAGLEVGPELAGLASFRVWKVDTQAPQRTERQAAQRFPRNPGAAAWGWWGGKRVRWGGWSDAGASRRIRDLTSFSEERRLLRAGEQNSLRRGAKEGCFGGGLFGERGGIGGGW